MAATERASESSIFTTLGLFDSSGLRSFSAPRVLFVTCVAAKTVDIPPRPSTDSTRHFAPRTRPIGVSSFLIKYHVVASGTAAARSGCARSER